MKELRINLKKVLEKSGLSQRELSHITGIRFPSVSEMCLNKSKRLGVENLAMICEVCKCDISDLLELVDVEGDREFKDLESYTYKSFTYKNEKSE